MPLSTKLFAATALLSFEARGANVFRGGADSQPEPLALDAEVVTAHEGHFVAFMASHGKAYAKGTEEWNMRYSVFMKRMAQVEHLNSRPGRSWTAGLNHFADATDAELQGLLGYKHDKAAAARRVEESRKSAPTEEVVDHCAGEGDCLKDWGLNLTSLFIRDQGQCGSCWAVTASTVLDARSEINGTNRTFSTQNIVDCVPNPHNCGGSGGCDGATVELAFMYAMKQGLGCPEKYGMYTARDGDCPVTINSTSGIEALTAFAVDTKVHHASPGDTGLSYAMNGWRRLATNQYAPLMKAVLDGPVAVALAANDLFMYASGIFDECSDFVVNHAVTLVGYGKEGDKKFWVVQNSWGTSWGEEGKIRIFRSDDEDSVCGMDDQPQQGIACEGETDPVQVCGTCGILFDSIVPLFDKEKKEGTDSLC